MKSTKKNLSYFDKIDILKNGHDGLTLGYLSWLKKINEQLLCQVIKILFYLPIYSQQLFCQAMKILL